MYFEIPKSGVPSELREQIKSRLPEPQQFDGWKFNDYVWRKLSQINTRDEYGNTDNTVRNGGTGDSESLQVSLSRGMDVTQHTPSIFPEDNLANGFNRLKNLKQLGYTEWVFALYEYDPESSNEFQSSMRESLDDFRASSNAGNGQKPITDEEVIEQARKRFVNRPVVYEDIKGFVESLKLNFSGQKVRRIAQRVVRDHSRKGVIESYNRDEAERYLDDNGIGADLLNSKDLTRVQRLIPTIMKNFVQNTTTMNLVLFDSDAASHEELDSRQRDTINQLKELDELILQYATARIINRDVSPYEILGSVPQKIRDGFVSDGLESID